MSDPWCSSISLFKGTSISDQDRISPYNIKQTSDENKEKFQLGDYKLIHHQILQINITRIV